MHSCHVLLSLWAWLGACTSTAMDQDWGYVSRATAEELSLARGIVEWAQAESAKLNGARMDNPARNSYWAGRKGWVSPPPLLNITPKISSAATMVSDAEGALGPGISNKTSVEKRAGGFWMETLPRKGTVSWGDDPNYKVREWMVVDLMMIWPQLTVGRSFGMSSITALIRQDRRYERLSTAIRSFACLLNPRFNPDISRIRQTPSIVPSRMEKGAATSVTAPRLKTPSFTSPPELIKWPGPFRFFSGRR